MLNGPSVGAAHAAEARALQHLGELRLARLRAQRFADFLGERGRDADHGRGVVVEPADRVGDIVAGLVAGDRLDDHPGAVGLQDACACAWHSPRGSPMSCRQSNMVTRSKSRSAMSLAAAVSKLDAVGEAVRLGVGVGLLDRRARGSRSRRSVLFGKALAISSVEKPTPQPTSATLAPACSLRQHAVQRRQPGLDDGVDIARPEEGADGAEQAAGAFAPGDAAAGAEGRLDLGLALDHRRARSKAPSR